MEKKPGPAGNRNLNPPQEGANFDTVHFKIENTLEAKDPHQVVPHNPKNILLSPSEGFPASGGGSG
jgi:hypothetical protein